MSSQIKTKFSELVVKSNIRQPLQEIIVSRVESIPKSPQDFFHIHYIDTGLHSASAKAQKKAGEKKPTVYYYGSGKKKTVREVEAPPSKSKAKSRAKGGEKVEMSKEFREEYNRLRRELMEKVASGELTPEEAQRVLRSIRGLGTYYGTVEGARRKGQISKEKYKEYVSKFKNIKLPKLIYGKVPKGWVSEWDDPSRYMQLKHQLQNFYQKYGKYLSEEDKQVIERLLEMHYLPGDLDKVIRDTELEILSIVHRPSPKEKRLRKFELEHQPSLVKVPFTMGEAPAKISYEELFGKGVKTPDIDQYVPGMEFLQMSYSASKRQATTGLKLESTWEEKVEKALKENEKLGKKAEKLKLEYDKLLSELRSKYPNLYKAIERLDYYKDKPYTVEIGHGSGIFIEKGRIIIKNKELAKDIDKINNILNKMNKVANQLKDINAKIEANNRIIREGPKPFERSFTGILWGGLEQLNKIIPRELDYAIGLLNPATMPKTIESIVKGKKPSTVIELAGVPVGVLSAVESTITEGIPGLLSLVGAPIGVPVKSLTHVPDWGEIAFGYIAPPVSRFLHQFIPFIPAIERPRRAEKELEFMYEHPGFAVGALIGEYLTGKALGRIFTPAGKASYKAGKYIVSKAKTPAIRIGEAISRRAKNVVRKLLPNTYEEYFRLGSKIKTETRLFGTFLKEQYISPAIRKLAKKLVKRETKYFKEEFVKGRAKGFSKPTPEGGVIGIPELELKTKQIPISFEEYLKLQKELAKNIDEVIGKYSKFLVTEGGEAWDINIAKAKWQTDLINAIRGGGEKGFGGSFMLRNIDIGDVVDALRGISYEGFKGEFKSGIPVKEYYWFERVGPETIKAKMFYRTTFKVPKTFFEFEFTPEAFARYIGGEGGEAGLKGFKGFPGGPKGPGGFKPTTMKTLELLGGKIELLPKQEGLLTKLKSGIKITAKSTSKPIVGLSAKTVTTGLNIPIILPKITTITMPKISEGVLAPQITIPKISTKLEPKIGVREKEEVKPVLSIGPKLEIKPPQIPNIVNILKPVVGVKPTTELNIRVGPMPKVGIDIVPANITGLGEIPATMQITLPKITTTTTTPPEYPTSPEYPSPPKIPGGPIIPPIPRLLGARYPGEYGVGKYSRAWWSTWFRAPSLSIGGIDIGLLLPKKKVRKKKGGRKKSVKKRSRKKKKIYDVGKYLKYMI